MKITVTGDSINSIIGVAKKLEKVKDTMFQIRLLRLITDLENVKTEILADSKELVQAYETKIKEIEAVHEEKNAIVQKYAIKDEKGLFVLEESVAADGTTVENYTFPVDEKLLSKRDKELKPIFEKIRKGTEAIEAIYTELYSKKAEVKVNFFETKDRSQWFDLEEFRIFTALTNEEVAKKRIEMEEGKS